MTRVPVSPPLLRFPPDPQRTSYINTLSALPFTADWAWIARQQFPHTTFVVHAQPGEITEAKAQALEHLGRVLASYGHQLVIDEEGQELREATTL
jgi:hypothetical protein